MEIKKRDYIDKATNGIDQRIFERATPEIIQAEIAKLETFTLFGEEYISTMTGAIKKAEIIGFDFDYDCDDHTRFRIVARGGAKFAVYGLKENAQKS